jgi:hypothetical protein
MLRDADKFSVQAVPAEYSSSGVVTFLVKQDGTAYEKDLGKTAASGASATQPDDSWKQLE